MNRLRAAKLTYTYGGEKVCSSLTTAVDPTAIVAYACNAKPASTVATTAITASIAANATTLAIAADIKTIAASTIVTLGAAA